VAKVNETEHLVLGIFQELFLGNPPTIPVVGEVLQPALTELLRLAKGATPISLRESLLTEFAADNKERKIVYLTLTNGVMVIFFLMKETFIWKLAGLVWYTSTEGPPKKESDFTNVIVPAFGWPEDDA
jgi:hypothetical protein